jgi:hypothetical protein
MRIHTFAVRFIFLESGKKKSDKYLHSKSYSYINQNKIREVRQRPVSEMVNKAETKDLITGMTRGQIPIPCLSMVEKQNCL